MANQIYEITHEGLSAVISGKAATQVLRKALESQGHDAKSVTGSEMRDVLMGPVHKELTGILPKDGVERTLKEIIKALKKQAKEAKAAREAAEEVSEETSSQPALHGASSDHGSIPTPNEEVSVAAHALLFEDIPSDQPALAQVKSKVEAIQTQVAVKTVMPPTAQILPLQPRSYSQEELSGYLMRFAQVENIKLVAIVQSNGVIKQSRGSGFDLAAISRIGSMGLKLLSRGRHIHSFYLSHQKGQLFLFPLADHTLIVVGNSDVNVGEVFSTLEESI
jgi:hypothetical protein